MKTFFASILAFFRGLFVYAEEDIHSIIAPIHNIRERLDAYAEKEKAAMNEKVEEIADLKSEIEQHVTNHSHASALSRAYSQLADPSAVTTAPTPVAPVAPVASVRPISTSVSPDNAQPPAPSAAPAA